MAVEFNDHFAAAWIALDKGFFEEEGLNVTRLETFTTGLELSVALTKGDVDVAWACSGPLILARAQGVPIVVVDDSKARPSRLPQPLPRATRHASFKNG
jgi:NitT/TauT family transport system substrate-binding protein